MGLFEKIKLSMMKPENKEKYLLEKERESIKKSKEEDGNESEEKNDRDVKKVKKVKVVKKRVKVDNKEEVKNNESKRADNSKDYEEDKEPSDESINNEKVRYSEDNTKEDKKRVEISEYEKSKRRLEEIQEKLSKGKNDDSNRNNVIEDKEIIEFNEEEENKGEVKEEDKSNDEDGKELSELDLAIERSKEEKVRLKLEEKEKYFEMIRKIPPTSDIDRFIKLALNMGVPEWYLREENYIKDDAISEDEMEDKYFELLVSFPPLNNDNLGQLINLAEEKGISKEYLRERFLESGIDINSYNNDDDDEKEEERNVSIEENEDVKFNDTIEEDNNVVNREVEIVEEEELEVKGDLEFGSSRDVYLEKDDTVDLEEIENEVSRKVDIEDNEELDLSEQDDFDEGSNRSIVLEDNDEEVLEETIDREVADSNRSITVEDEDNVDLEEDNKLSDDDNTVIENSQTTEEVKDDKDNDVGSVIDKDNLLKRLANLKIKRKVLSISENKMLVKEEYEDEEGKTKSKYNNYKLDEHVGDIEEGQELPEDVALEKEEYDTFKVNGEEYDVSEEEEKEIISVLERKEVWVITTDTEYVKELDKKMESTRYKILNVLNESDFMVATRSTGNLLVITQKIPAEVKSSIIGFLKYLKEEKVKYRLVTLENSKVKADVIEYILDDLDEENLNNYFEKFDHDMYGTTSKNIKDMLDVISFDITDSLEGYVEVDMDIEKELDNVSKDRIDFEGGIDVELDDEGSKEKKEVYDKEVSFDDTIDLDDLKS